MRKVQCDQVFFWQFDLLLNCPEIVHGSFLRHGGVSEEDFASLNASYQVGDAEESVRINCEKIRSALGLSSLAFAKQNHGAEREVIVSPYQNIGQCDALLTDLAGTGLMITHADCQAALFYDPIQKWIAAVHAGWRGAVLQIYTKTIQHMKELWRCQPENLLVCISPSLGPDDAEFIHFRKELPEKFWDYQVRPTYFDFWAIAQDELQDAGVLPHHIEIARISTYAYPEDYFSYRRVKRSGRLATAIGMKNSLSLREI
jgi:YfiH family protein